MAGLVGPVEISGEALHTFGSTEGIIQSWKHQLYFGSTRVKEDNLIGLEIHALVGIIAGVGLAYFAILFGGNRIIHFFYGEDPATRYLDTVGLPVIILISGCEAIGSIVTLPFRLRNRRLCGEFFRIHPDNNTLTFEEEREVSRILGDMAVNLQRAFSNQERARTASRRNPKVKTDYEDREARRRKTRFWTAYGVAKKFGVSVGDSYEDHLPSAA